MKAETTRAAPAFLNPALTQSRTATVAAALIALGLGALVASGPADAGSFGPPTPSSRVDATVTPDSGGSLYKFSVFNTTPIPSAVTINSTVISPLCSNCTNVIVNWELPLFSLNDIRSGTILSPTNWTYEIIAPGASPPVSSNYYNDPTGPYGPYKWNYSAATDPLLATTPGLYGPNPSVFDNPPWIIHWYTLDNGSGIPLNSILPGGSLPGFEFISDFSSLNAPYLSSWYLLPPVSGDPPAPNNSFGTPNSPARQFAQGVPEPATVSLIALGLFMMGTLMRRRSQHA